MFTQSYTYRFIAIFFSFLAMSCTFTLISRNTTSYLRLIPTVLSQTCPLLLRVFCTYGRHHSPYDYQKGIFPLTEFQIYTWYVFHTQFYEIIPDDERFINRYWYRCLISLIFISSWRF